ncbi:MAG: ABC transporter ATP-binding protein [Alphaproteobacteria bacterium]|nr:ABC transporter ATP-binding protein [Alphaproteobacteria bacterium]
MIAVTGLEVHYGALRLGPLDLRLDAGIVHLVGSNGTGKTSLLRAMAAAIPRSAGTVEVDGHDPERDATARGRIGFVPAAPELPGFLTVDEAWRMMADLRRRPDWDGTELRDAFDLPGAQRLDRASTGMRRKAEVVAALAGDPTVLLLDETLANIDVRGREVLCEWLDRHRGDRAVILTHHGASPVRPDAVVTLG